MSPAHKNPVVVQFGRNLRRCRLGTGQSQEKFGARVGLHRTEISRLELGGRAGTLDASKACRCFWGIAGTTQ